MHWYDTPQPQLHPIEWGRMIAPEHNSSPHRITIHTQEWHHLASARFGPARPCSWSPATHWTGDSYRYDIFIHPQYRQEALRWWNGSGDGWLITPDSSSRGEQSLLRHIAGLDNEAIRWDYCHFLWQASERSRLAGEAHGTHQLTTAFLEGRLKRRRRSGTTSVEIVPNIHQLEHTGLP
jgi:hypothetical protein